LAILPLSLTHLLSKRSNMLPTPTKIRERFGMQVHSCSEWQALCPPVLPSLLFSRII
jgi:hypothetical protein